MVVRLGKTTMIRIDEDSESGLYVTHSNFGYILHEAYRFCVCGVGKST